MTYMQSFEFYLKNLIPIASCTIKLLKTMATVNRCWMNFWEMIEVLLENVLLKSFIVSYLQQFNFQWLYFNSCGKVKLNKTWKANYSFLCGVRSSIGWVSYYHAYCANYNAVRDTWKLRWTKLSFFYTVMETNFYIREIDDLPELRMICINSQAHSGDKHESLSYKSMQTYFWISRIFRCINKKSKSYNVNHCKRI